MAESRLEGIISGEVTNGIVNVLGEDQKVPQSRLDVLIGDLIEKVDDLIEKVDDLDDLNTYSTDEKVVGTWIDGKPIYRKTIVQRLTDATQAGSYLYNHNIDNFDIAIRVEFMLRNTADNVSVVPQLIPISSTGAGGPMSIRLHAFFPTNFQIDVGGNRSGFEVLLTVYYTKTTD